jgi:magnesium chelatase accessory protein
MNPGNMPHLGAQPRPRSRMVPCESVRWHVEIAGDGPALLLLHGTGASSHSFRELMPLLARRFTVVAPDLPGHASSEPSRWFEPTLSGTAAALEELLDALHLVPEVVVGHSAGAALAARMTLDRAIEPRLVVGIAAALVPFQGVARAILPQTARLLSLASRILPLRVSSAHAVRQILRSTGSRLDGAGVEMYRELSAQPEHVAGVLAMMGAWDLEPLFAELPRLEVPLLLVAGQDDRAVPLSQQRAIAARTKRTKLIVVPGAGHLVHEEAPAKVGALIFAELDALGRQMQPSGGKEFLPDATTGVGR